MSPSSARPRRSLGRLAAAATLLAALAGAAPLRADAAGPRAAPARLAPTFGGLAALGEWVRLAGGEKAWRPDGVAADWQPYRVGHWAWTSDGWFWVSGEPWAWATYHHGRWRFDGRFGWVWLPGSTWAPAAVVWRFGPGVVGWAPLTDDGLVLPSHWTFLPSSRFTGVPVARAAIAGARVPGLLAQSRVAAASAGPLPSSSSSAAVEPPPMLIPARAAVDPPGSGAALARN